MSRHSRVIHSPFSFPAALRDQGYRFSKPAIRSFCPGRGRDLAWVPDETNDITTTTVITRKEEYLKQKESPLQTWIRSHEGVPHSHKEQCGNVSQSGGSMYPYTASPDTTQLPTFAEHRALYAIRISPRILSAQFREYSTPEGCLQVF